MTTPEGNSAWQAMRDQSPDEWDGQRYSEPAYNVQHFEASCLHCGELYDLDTLASRRCGRCGGPMSIEPAGVGAVGSPLGGRVVRSTQDTWVPTRRTR
jgi:hypothetical protein